MERSEYVSLRLEIEQEISNAFSSPNADIKDTVNCVMRLFIQAVIHADVKRQKSAQQFKEFKRNTYVKTPSWAYKNPGLSSRLPTLKEA